MGKHNSNGIPYFNIDCLQKDDINFIEAKHGIVGYGVLIKLWRRIYMLEGYYCDWSERSIYLFSREIGVPVDEVRAIVETCFEEKLFDRSMYDCYKILTGSEPQNKWLSIVTLSKRKNNKIDPKFELFPEIPEEPVKTPEEPVKTPEEIPQSKVKESRVKESKEKHLAPASPAPPKKSVKETPEETEPFWKELVAVWFEFNKEKFGEYPVFIKDDPRILKRIIQLLKTRASKKNETWNEQTAPSRLKLFFVYAYQDAWLSTHFTLSNLEKQYNVIIQQQSKVKEQQHKEQQNKKNAAPVTFEDTLNYLYSRFLEGELKTEIIDPMIYDKLVTRNHIKPGYLNQVPGSDIDDKKRNVVIDFFKAKKQREHAKESV